VNLAVKISTAAVAAVDEPFIVRYMLDPAAFSIELRR
jgi:hypothetical protein